MIAAIAITAIAVAIGLGAWFGLGPAGQQQARIEMLKLAVQAIVIVILGVVVKAVVDSAQADRARREQDDLRRAGYARRLVDASHAIELARTYMWADRSVATWDRQMRRIIRAYVELRDVRHDVTTFSATGRPLFGRWDDILDQIKSMEAYLVGLVDEYREEKRHLMDAWTRAGDDGAARDDAWSELQKLCRIGAFLRDDGDYGRLRDAYGRALRDMRSPSGTPR
ncbi:hypothetical protein [Agromyces kandeliae]|uniref:DUF4760 domain-containing protein n=1 Tax=Agromyces kandeliae TaxID=2666141 RepID=A0A6L5R4A0_9MICO|nr:hypothetical protein [Agromyces kandeliae]MRX44770.1 hypothetical protein [Agromyces kandeliae]